MLRLNPTSGVGLENAGEFLNNGCVGVGLVAPLFNPVMVQEEVRRRREAEVETQGCMLQHQFDCSGTFLRALPLTPFFVPLCFAELGGDQG